MRSWRNVLKLPLIAESPRIQFAVIGNGFAGSDYLSIPEDVAVLDARYLLLSKFTEGSVFTAIDEYQNTMEKISNKVSGEIVTNKIELADFVIEIPSWEIPI